MTATAGVLGRYGRALLDLVLPPRCLACGVTVEGAGTVCPPCWRGLTFIAAPQCERCGLPFTIPSEPGTLCGACVGHPPAYRRARAALAYDDASRPLLLTFKHSDATHAAAAFAGWMRRAAAELTAEADVLAAVPLHRRRLMRRRYNQAALLALALAKRSGRPAAVDLLVRHRPTPSQKGADRAARRRNVRGAFAVRPGRAALVEGRTVLLIDDVLTTGATVEECARVLQRAGAASVDVLTLARVVRPAR